MSLIREWQTLEFNMELNRKPWWIKEWKIFLGEPHIVHLTIECNLIFCQSIHTQMNDSWMWWEWQNIKGTHSYSYIISGRIREKLDYGRNYLNTLYTYDTWKTNTIYIIAPNCTFMSTINLRTLIHIRKCKPH